MWYQNRKNVPNSHKIYKHFPIQGPQKFTQIEIFGLKINHLTTLTRWVCEKVVRNVHSPTNYLSKLIHNRHHGKK
jgi:hypothetical protein